MKRINGNDRLKLFLALVLTLLLPACTLRAPARPRVNPAAAAALPPLDTPVAAAAIPSAPAAAVDPTAMLAPTPDGPVIGSGIPAEPELPQELLGSQPPEPLKFTFPTAPADGVSLWRAPLYPVPWEPTPNDHFYFTRPIGANEVNWPLARYRYGYLMYAEPHSGIDIPAPKGTPILAAGPGTVIWAGYGLYFQRNIEEDPYGIAVAIQHDFGYKDKTLYTVYGHMNETYMYRGQRVEAGEPLGVVGETGRVSGPHLHFEVRVGDDTYFTIRNPELWISPPQDTGVLAGRLMDSTGDKTPGVLVMLRSLEGKGNFDVLSYAENKVNADEYYNENVVLGDVPAGEYTVLLDYDGEVFRFNMTIQAGLVNFFTYHQRGQPVFGPPPTLDGGFVPPDATATPEK